MSVTLKDTCQFTNFLKIRSKLISPEPIKPEATHQGGIWVFTKLHIQLIKIYMYIYYIYIYYIWIFAVLLYCCLKDNLVHMSVFSIIWKEAMHLMDTKSHLRNKAAIHKVTHGLQYSGIRNHTKKGALSCPGETTQWIHRWTPPYISIHLN
jgi:hypothetical protein